MRAHTTFIVVLSLLLLSSPACYGDFTSSSYQSQTRQQKLNQIWNNVIADTTSGSFPSLFTAGGLFLESMSPSVNYVSDSLPAGRRKYVHSVGSVYTCSFTPTADSPYTGFFQGADSIVSRFSLAKEPSYSDPSASSAYNNFIPAVAFKFLVDGLPSANIFSMNSVNGIQSYNLFDYDFNSHIPGPTGIPLNLVADKFSQGTDIVQFLGLRRAAEQTQDGQSVQNPVYPFMVTFQARDDVKAMFTSDYTVDYSVTLNQIPVGTALFDVYATASPTDGCKQLIGTITTTSEITTSAFGDNTLFFQHPNYHYDLGLRPEWTPYTPVWNIFGSRNSQLSVATGCPYADLFQ